MMSSSRHLIPTPSGADQTGAAATGTQPQPAASRPNKDTPRKHALDYAEDIEPLAGEVQGYSKIPRKEQSETEMDPPAHHSEIDEVGEVDHPPLYGASRPPHMPEQSPRYSSPVGGYSGGQDQLQDLSASTSYRDHTQSTCTQYHSSQVHTTQFPLTESQSQASSWQSSSVFSFLPTEGPASSVRVANEEFKEALRRALMEDLHETGQAQLSRGMDLMQKPLLDGDAEQNLSFDQKLSKALDKATGQEAIDMLITSRFMKVMTDELSEDFDRDLVGDRFRHKDIQNGTWIKFVKYPPFAHNFDVPRNNSTRGGLVPTNVRLAFVLEQDEEHYYAVVANPQRGPGFHSLPHSVQESRIELKDINTYEGPGPLPEDCVYTYGVQFEAGACLDAFEVQISKDAPMKLVAGQILSESRQVLIGRIDERYRKLMEQRNTNTFSAEEYMEERAQKEAKGAKTSNQTATEHSFESGSPYSDEQGTDSPALEKSTAEYSQDAEDQLQEDDRKQSEVDGDGLGGQD